MSSEKILTPEQVEEIKERARKAKFCTYYSNNKHIFRGVSRCMCGFISGALTNAGLIDEDVSALCETVEALRGLLGAIIQCEYLHLERCSFCEADDSVDFPGSECDCGFDELKKKCYAALEGKTK